MSETSKEFDRIVKSTVAPTNDFLNRVGSQSEGLTRLPNVNPITEDDVVGKCQQARLTLAD